MNLSETLRTYINDELYDYECYTQLGNNAPDLESQQMLYDMANDGVRHAEEFKILYNELTGEQYNPKITTTMQRRSYRDGLRDRALSDGRSYRRYMRHYNNGGIEDALLLSALFGAGIDKNLNSIALLYLLSRF
ncbi:MAG: hypothetical protein AB9836_00390 [Aminipila sp.]